MADGPATSRVSIASAAAIRVVMLISILIAFVDGLQPAGIRATPQFNATSNSAAPSANVGSTPTELSTMHWACSSVTVRPNWSATICRAWSIVWGPVAAIAGPLVGVGSLTQLNEDSSPSSVTASSAAPVSWIDTYAVKSTPSAGLANTSTMRVDVPPQPSYDPM